MTTKILALSLTLLAVGCQDRYEGQAGAASSPAASASPYTAGSGAYASPGTTTGSLGPGSSVSAVVVSVDSAGRTITLREPGTTGAASTGAGGSQGRRFNVAAAAATSLESLKPGTTVTVTCDTAGSGSMSGGVGSGTAATGTGTTGTGTTGTTGTGTTGTGTTGAGGLESGSMVSGSLASCTTVTMIRESGAAAAR